MSTLEAQIRPVSVAVAPAQGQTDPATLFSLIVGELLSDLKSGCRIANCIEADLIKRGWPVGMIYGSESELSQRFQVGRAVIREAVRVLEVRGSARMRRGPHGGLQTLRPQSAQSVEMTADYVLLLGVQGNQIADARALIKQVKAQIDRRIDLGEPYSDELTQSKRVAVAFFEDLISTTQRLLYSNDTRKQSGSITRPLFHHSRAGQIARRLMTECTPQQWVKGIRLGSIFDLCERYRIDRGVLRQAIRILESAGMAVSLCGRGHGLVTQAPRPASVCRLVSCHFAAYGLSTSAAMELFHCISVEAAAKAAELAAPAQIARIRLALAAAERADEAKLAHAVFELEESQFAVLDNPLIDLFLRSTKAFPSWHIANNANSAMLNSVYLNETRKVAAAIARNDRAGAATAQHLKFCRLAEISAHPCFGKPGDFDVEATGTAA